MLRTDADVDKTHSHTFGDEILRVEVGSTAHGTGVSGTDDLDLMAIVIPPIEQVVGLHPFEHYIYRTATIRTGRVDAKSEPGDIDLTIYSLQKFVGLARKGNPSILNVFFAPVHYATPQGERLRRAAPLFQSKEAGRRFLGYMNAQKHRLVGERGQKGVNRPELVEKYGYDTKYAYHIIRLGLQGLQFLNTGKISVPMPEHLRLLLLAIREGQYTQERIFQWAEELESEMLEVLAASKLPETAPEGPINQLLVSLHEEAWSVDTRW